MLEIIKDILFSIEKSQQKIKYEEFKLLLEYSNTIPKIKNVIFTKIKYNLFIFIKVLFQSR